MKKTLITFAAICGLATASASFAQSAEEMKAAALEACDTQAASIPEAQRGMVLDMCKCSVESSDYEAMLKASSSGDAKALEEVQAAALEAGQKCAAKVAG